MSERFNADIKTIKLCFPCSPRGSELIAEAQAPLQTGQGIENEDCPKHLNEELKRLDKEYPTLGLRPFKLEECVDTKSFDVIIFKYK